MRKDEFYKDLIIKDEDKARAEKAIFSKGVEQHILLKNKMLAWSQSEKVKYTELASTFRYDKRIRNISYKYIAYFEEFCRGVILDAFIDNAKEQSFWIAEIKEKLGKDNLHTVLENLDFLKLIKQLEKLPQAIRVINENIESTKFIEKSTIINKDYMLVLKEMSIQKRKFDIIFLDPPYESDFAEKALSKIIELDILNQNGIVIIETDNTTIEADVSQNKGVNIYDIRKYGRVMLIFIRRS